ncbi:hypothetical protein ACIRD9_42620 [Streptomyces violaceus]|uniref:hypothetical protein n=1 Tax=Streptomyces violaceus TaxID=1936 RepID=UPI00381BE2C1
MGDIIPLADYARGDRVIGAPESPWLRPAPDWDPCDPCPVRGACREVRECYDDARAQPPDITLRLVPPPDIIA